MSKLLRKPKQEFPDDTGKFEIYNLKENPFPATPIINQADNDIRYNGGIFEGQIRSDEWNKVVNNFLKVSQNNPNHLRIGYLIDTSYVGRGNGKSSFCVNLLKIINKDFCLDITDGENKCFGLYISPETSGRTKSFYDLVDLIFETIVNAGLINACLAGMRLEAIISLTPGFKVEEEFQTDEEIITKLNDFNWFAKNGVEIARVTKEVLKQDSLSRLPEGFPLFRDKSNFYATRITTQEDFKDYYEHLKKHERLEFIFSYMVNFFIAGGFNGAYIFVDDFERIPDFQSDRQKREFAAELRASLFDGMSTNAKVGFYNLILVLHAGVPRLIEKSWAETGLELRSPINTANKSSKHVIFFEKLTPDNAVLLVKRYLKVYRINEVDKENEDLSPFTKTGIAKIGEISEMNAAGILQKAHQALEKALEEKVNVIDEDFIVKLFGQSKKIELEEYGDPSEEDEVTDLLTKSKNK